MIKLIVPGALSILLLSCTINEKEIQGIYESKSGDQVGISCYNQFSAEKPFEESNMPKNGAGIEVIVNEETVDVCFVSDNVISSFGKWDPEKRELIIQGVKYKWIKKPICGVQQRSFPF